MERTTQSFYQRVKEAKKKFIKKEKQIKTLIEKKQHEDIIKVFNQIFKDLEIAFEVGYNGEKYELILSLEGDSTRIFELEYFKEQMPNNILKNWDIVIGRKPMKNFTLKMFNINISADDVDILPSKNGQELNLTVFSEKLLPLFKDNINNAYTLFYILLDNTIGEINAMKYIHEVTILTEPLTNSIKLSKLLEYTKKEFKGNNLTDYKQLSQQYVGYQNPKPENCKIPTREDIIAGFTCLYALISGYFNNDNYTVNELNNKGIFTGYLAFPNSEEDPLEFRNYVEEKITKQLGQDYIKFIGGATGTNFLYLDFIAWDLAVVLKTIKKITKSLAIKEVSIQSFNANEKIIIF